MEVGFTADVSEFVANARLAAQASRDFRDQVLADVAEIKAALASLPDVVRVRVDVDRSGLGGVAGTAGAAAGVGAQEQLTDAINATRDAQAKAAATAAAEARAASDAASAEYKLAMAERMRANSAREAAQASSDGVTATDLAAASEQFEADTVRILTAAKVALARAEQVLTDATDEAAAGQIAYLALSNEVSDATLQDAIAFGIAGEAARKYATDEAAAAAMAQTLSTATWDVARSSEAAKAAEFDQAAVTLASIDATLTAARAEALYGEAMKASSMSSTELALAQAEAAKATGAAGAAAGRGARLWGVMPLTWNAIHLALTGTAEVLAVVVPAMVALGSAAAVGLQGAVDVGQRMNAVYTTTEATMSYLGKTLSTGIGAGLDSFTQSAGAAADAGAKLHDNLQKAQDAAQPRVYELLGAAINGANDKFGVFNTVGSQTITMLDAFGAKLDVELAGPMGNFASQLTSHAVPDLQQLGQVFGNLGHTIASAAADMPGMAEVLLRILDDGTKVLNWALHFQGVMQGLFLAHEAQMWGKLTSNALGGVSTALSKGVVALGGWAKNAIPFEGAAVKVEGAAVDAGSGLAKVASFLGGPWGTALIGAGIGLALLAMKFGDVKNATQQMISGWETAVADSSGLEQIGATYQALTHVTDSLVTATAKLNTEESHIVLRGRGRAINESIAATQDQAGAVRDLSGAQQQLNTDWTTEMSNVKLLSSEYKISYVQAAMLAGDAGVSLTQTLKGNSIAAQQANQMIKNLIAGYGGMASTGSQLGQDINAVSFAADIQNGDITKLNQAWDTFFSTVQAPSSTFLSFAQSLTQFASDAKKSGAEMSGLGGATVKSSHDISNASIQLQQDFNSSAQSAESMLGSMRTVAAITGKGGPLVAGIKDVVQALIPMAGHNEAARAQLFALAQEAGGPASGSMRSLAKWAGHTKDPLNNLYSLSMKSAGAIQKLGTDTQNLAKTVQSTLNQTLVTEAENITGVSANTATYLNDLKNLGAASPVTQAALANLNDSTSQAISLSSQAASAESALNGKQQQLGDGAATASPHQQQLTRDIQGILKVAPGASGAVQGLVTAIENQKSAAAQHGAEKALADALQHTGMMAYQASAYVDQLRQDIEKLQSKTISITVIERALGSLPAAATSPGSVHGIRGPAVGGATGMLVPGHGRGDTVPAMLEPGEAVVPRHLVPSISGFLGAHHVPGFARGGIAHGRHGLIRGHGGEAGLSAGAIIFEEWTREVLARKYLHSHDWVQMEQLMGRGHIVIGHNDRVSGFLMHDMLRRAGRLHTLEWELHHQGGAGRPGETFGPGVIGGGGFESLPPRVLKRLIREALGGGQLPFGIYDKGGYLPLGWSLAYNGTRKPEAVGGGGGDVHVHLHGDLADDSLWDRLQVTTADYSRRNDGLPTGKWQPS